MGSRDCFLGMTQGNPERRVTMAQQCNYTMERQRRGLFPSAAEEVAVVDNLSLRCIQFG